MFIKRAERKEIQLLKNKVEQLRLERSALDETSDRSKSSQLFRQIADHEFTIAALESDGLLNKAEELGIEFPPGKKSWWFDDLDFKDPDSYRSYLTDAGKAGVAKLIRDERKKNAEWWVKTVVSVITALTGLVGTLIGIFAVLDNNFKLHHYQNLDR
jgi:hypothetical protein